MRLLTRSAFFAIGVYAGLCSLKAIAQQAPGADEVWKRRIHSEYLAHDERVKRILPPHSALPPILKSDKRAPDNGSGISNWYVWKGPLFVSGALTDPGLRTLPEATSIVTTFLDGGHVLGLPARSASAVVVAVPENVIVAVDPAHSLVYSQFSLKLTKVLKGEKKIGIQEGAIIAGVENGGSVCFPSGHIETFVLAEHGFMELGKEYLIFAWRPNRSVETYMVGEAYLIQGDQVFPINSVPEAHTYEAMPLERFESLVRNAIARDVNTD